MIYFNIISINEYYIKKSILNDEMKMFWKRKAKTLVLVIGSKNGMVNKKVIIT